jgi:hypothetical protein
MKENKHSNIKYIYNPIQANFFITNGCKCIGTGFNAKSDLGKGKVYFNFDYFEVQKLYPLWEEYKNQRNFKMRQK